MRQAISAPLRETCIVQNLTLMCVRLIQRKDIICPILRTSQSRKRAYALDRIEEKITVDLCEIDHAKFKFSCDQCRITVALKAYRVAECDRYFTGSRKISALLF